MLCYFRWANYIKGIIANFHARESLESGFNAAVLTSVPLGGGVSSSAALEVSFYTLFEALTNNLGMILNKIFVKSIFYHKYF